MSSLNPLSIGALAVLGLTASTAALAVEAVSTVNLNIRSGPGTGYSVVDTLDVGEPVDVVECTAPTNGWCRIYHVGPDGWVAGKYLAAGLYGGSGYDGGSDYDDGDGDYDDGGSDSGSDIQFGVTIPLPGGGSITFGTGGGTVNPPNQPSPPPAPTPTDEVCFYKGANYTGASFCRPVGASQPNMVPIWNDSISSVEIRGDARVKLCQHVNFGGYCATYNNSRANLNGFLNDQLSSYEVLAAGIAPPPPPPPATAEACFYKGNNFTGAKVCRPAGTTRPTMAPAWNDAASSFTVAGGAKVKLCVNNNFGGNCAIYTSDRAVLNGAFNNRVSSYAVFTGAPPATPTPGPVTHSTGSINLPQTHLANLDNGNVGAGGADIWYQAQNPIQKFISPRNGAQLALGDGSNRGFAGCSAASYSTNRISIWAMPVGSYVCARTNQGRISQFRLNGYTGTTMNLGYTTWQN